MQAEVQRLKLLVQTAANDLTQAERHSCVAGAKVEHAAQAFEASAHGEQPLRQPSANRSSNSNFCFCPNAKLRFLLLCKK
ncbi:hypothetical protein DIPPA_29392 [Diplonema papillatum]|nr:hypothetical protein DIPPA_29392 [Diplonema papillatum]